MATAGPGRRGCGTVTVRPARGPADLGPAADRHVVPRPSPLIPRPTPRTPATGRRSAPGTAIPPPTRSATGSWQRANLPRTVRPALCWHSSVARARSPVLPHKRRPYLSLRLRWYHPLLQPTRRLTLAARELLEHRPMRPKQYQSPPRLRTLPGQPWPSQNGANSSPAKHWATVLSIATVILMTAVRFQQTLQVGPGGPFLASSRQG